MFIIWSRHLKNALFSKCNRVSSAVYSAICVCRVYSLKDVSGVDTSVPWVAWRLFFLGARLLNGAQTAAFVTVRAKITPVIRVRIIFRVPLYVGPFSLRSNQNCILCGNCVKVCENMSPVFNLRAPGHELWTIIKPEKLITIFVPVIIGTQLFRGLEHKEIITHLAAMTGHNWSVLAGLMAILVCVVFVYVRMAGTIVFGASTDGAVGQADLFNYVLVPLSFSFEVGYHFGPLLSRLGIFFSTLGHQVGFIFDFPDFSTFRVSNTLASSFHYSWLCGISNHSDQID